MNKLFKGLSFLVAMALITVLSMGCAKKPDKSQVVAEINNYLVTTDDLRDEAKLSIYSASKEQILQNIIYKELLLQEAQRINLDKDKNFMKEIENYWKQTLIKRLINMKGNEFLAFSQVSTDEIKAEYNRLSKENAGKIKPYEQMSGEIRERLRIKKAQVSLDSWIGSLRKNAEIKKYDEVLKAIKLKKIEN
ncbi:MAG: hypothetical protein KKD11_04135 [Candidatus Omnitrophica bacterium]|nr:hypothetical protein [Candidatus Omnitrophota bacterium]